MKKTLFVMPILFVIGLVFLIVPAYAASHSGDSLPSEDTLILQQTLDILKTTLNQLSAQIDLGDPLVLANAAAINESLVVMRGELLSLDGTLAGFRDSGPAIVETEGPKAISPAVSATTPAPAPPPKEIAQTIPAPNLAQQLAPALTPTLTPAPFGTNIPETTGMLTPAVIPPESGESATVASQNLSDNKLFWPGILILAAFATVWWMKTRGAKEVPAMKPAKIAQGAPHGATTAMKDLPIASITRNNGIDYDY